MHDSPKPHRQKPRGLTLRGAQARRQSQNGPTSRRTVRPARAGFSLFEMLATSVLLGTIMVVTVPTLGWIAREQRAGLRHQQALAEASNIMERLAAEPWEQVTSETLSKTPLSAHVRQQLPGAQLSVALHVPAGMPAAKQIALELSWSDQTGKQVAPLRLSAWIYKQQKSGQ